MIDDLERYLSPILLEEAPNIDIPILKETTDYLVINKPKGVLSHPTITLRSYQVLEILSERDFCIV